MKTITTIGLPALLLLAVTRPAAAWNWHPLWCYACDRPPPQSATFCYPEAGDPAQYPGGVPAWHWYGWGAARGGPVAVAAEQLPQPKTERPPTLPGNSSGPPLSPPKQFDGAKE